jgi:hypothetical protein
MINLNLKIDFINNNMIYTVSKVVYDDNDFLIGVSGI